MLSIPRVTVGGFENKRAGERARAGAIISRTDDPVKSWFTVAQKHREVIRAIGQLNSIVTATELLTRGTRNVHVATGHKIRLVESPNLYCARVFEIGYSAGERSRFAICERRGENLFLYLRKLTRGSRRKNTNPSINIYARVTSQWDALSEKYCN